MTERPFKQRYTEYKQSLPSTTSKMDPLERKAKCEHKSTLSAYCWKLFTEGIEYRIKWRINSKAFAYKNGARRCDLCIQEKLLIGLADPKTTLNSRNELTSKCRHKWKYTLSHCAGWEPPHWGKGMEFFWMKFKSIPLCDFLFRDQNWK